MNFFLLCDRFMSSEWSVNKISLLIFNFIYCFLLLSIILFGNLVQHTRDICGSSETFNIFGLDLNRIIEGNVRARIAYLPRGAPCGMALIQESQIAASIYHNYKYYRPLPVDWSRHLTCCGQRDNVTDQPLDHWNIYLIWSMIVWRIGKRLSIE